MGEPGAIQWSQGTQLCWLCLRTTLPYRLYPSQTQLGWQEDPSRMGLVGQDFKLVSIGKLDVLGVLQGSSRLKSEPRARQWEIF